MLHEFHLEPPSEKSLNLIFHLKVMVAGAPNEMVMVGEGKEADVLCWLGNRRLMVIQSPTANSR